MCRQLQVPEHRHGQHNDPQIEHDIETRRRQLERFEIAAMTGQHRVHRPDLRQRGADSELARHNRDRKSGIHNMHDPTRAAEPSRREELEVEVENRRADEEDAEAPEDGAHDGAAAGHHVPGLFDQDGAGEGEADEGEVGEEAGEDEVVVETVGEALDAAGVEAEDDGEDGEEGEEREGDHVGGGGGAGHGDVVGHGGRRVFVSPSVLCVCWGLVEAKGRNRHSTTTRLLLAEERV